MLFSWDDTNHWKSQSIHNEILFNTDKDMVRFFYYINTNASFQKIRESAVT